LIGCEARPKLVTVTGTVTHQNKALTAGSIWFHPAAGNPYIGEKPSCQLQLDGSFNMRTYPYGDGVPPGAYKITLSPELANRIRRPKYANPETTPLQLTVPDGGLNDQKMVVE